MQSWDEMAKFSKKRGKVFKAIGIAVERQARAQFHDEDEEAA